MVNAALVVLLFDMPEAVASAFTVALLVSVNGPL